MTEIDVFLPEYNYAFEYNRDCWHSSKVTERSYGMNSHEYHIFKKSRSLAKNI